MRGEADFAALVAALRASGRAGDADRLEWLVTVGASSSSLETWGEIGLVLQRVGPTLAPGEVDLRLRVEEGMEAVRRVWPGMR